MSHAGEIGITCVQEVEDMRLHKARLEQDRRSLETWIDTLPGCSVSADTQGEALVR